LKSAEWSSNYLGEEEIRQKQKSRGHSGGKASMNVSDNDRTRKLFSPDQFLRLGTGKCILINPGYISRDEVGIPVLQKIKIPEQIRKLQAWSKTKWNEKVRPRLGVGVACPGDNRSLLTRLKSSQLRIVCLQVWSYL